jgi:hypothetical protein
MMQLNKQLAWRPTGSEIHGSRSWICKKKLRTAKSLQRKVDRLKGNILGFIEEKNVCVTTKQTISRGGQLFEEKGKWSSWSKVCTPAEVGGNHSQRERDLFCPRKAETIKSRSKKQGNTPAKKTIWDLDLWASRFPERERLTDKEEIKDKKTKKLPTACK